MKQILLVTVFLTLAGCDRLSPSEKTAKALKSIQSWTATAQMVGEAWQQGNLPDPYARQTLAKSQKEIAQEIKAIPDSALRQKLQPLQQTLQQLTQETNQRHKPAIAPLLQILQHEQQQLAELVNATGVPQ